jgi:hypothetical protein
VSRVLRLVSRVLCLVSCVLCLVALVFWTMTFGVKHSSFTNVAYRVGDSRQAVI